MATVTLSTGEIVTLRARFTRAVYKAFFRAQNKDVKWTQNLMSGDWEKSVSPESIEFAFEAVMPLVIEKIELDGRTYQVSPDWIEDMLQEDYNAIERKFNELRFVRKEEGEKKEG